MENGYHNKDENFYFLHLEIYMNTMSIYVCCNKRTNEFSS